ncbi:hypothetical protein [Cerasicoccus maritimus]|uniref:hypothetical protein n=1 Tax=Cerasicoccus maritimus TaxID=490089 RepID=UPI002852D1EA|nr:hypothetical protein [Cerasicoccus maritimus]
MTFVNLNPVPGSQTVQRAALVSYIADDGREYPKGVFTTFADLEKYLTAMGRGSNQIYCYAGCIDPTQVSIGDQTVSIHAFRAMFEKAGVPLSIGVGFKTSSTHHPPSQQIGFAPLLIQGKKP